MLAATPKRYQPIRRFPSSEFDLSVLVAARTYSGDIENTLRSAASSAVEHVAFVREFTLPDGQRSLSFRVTVANMERTLTQEEITAERDKLIVAIRAAGYELR